MQILFKMFLQNANPIQILPLPECDQFLWYETNEKGERVLVKSIRSLKKAYIRFVNRTSRTVEVWWRDYNGERVYYTSMKPNSYYNADTYISHPWEFTDVSTKERFVINNKDIFRVPEPIGNMQYRTTWYITVPMRTLLNTVMLSIATRLSNVEQVDTLGLPKPLADEMKQLVSKLRAPSPVRYRR